VPLVKAVIQVLGEWRPAAAGIVYVESARRPLLTRDFADGLSRHLRIPVLGSYAIVDPTIPPDAGVANSAHRIAAVSRRFALQGTGDLDKVRRIELVEIDQRRVLLLDDLVVTGWTLTLAAQALRNAGATAVLPLALGTQS